MNDDLFDWKVDSMLEITLDAPDDFLKVKETLTRIGVASKKENKLYQSVHILHKRGRFFLVHFKELFIIDNKQSSLTHGDIARRNMIAVLLEDWQLLKIINRPSIDKNDLSSIKIISYKDKDKWVLVPKYNLGRQH